jgi:hypothetical protein
MRQRLTFKNYRVAAMLAPFPENGAFFIRTANGHAMLRTKARGIAISHPIGQHATAYLTRDIPFGRNLTSPLFNGFIR